MLQNKKIKNKKNEQTKKKRGASFVKRKVDDGEQRRAWARLPTSVRGGLGTERDHRAAPRCSREHSLAGTYLWGFHHCLQGNTQTGGTSGGRRRFVWKGHPGERDKKGHDSTRPPLTIQGETYSPGTCLSSWLLPTLLTTFQHWVSRLFCIQHYWTAGLILTLKSASVMHPTWLINEPGGGGRNCSFSKAAQNYWCSFQKKRGTTGLLRSFRHHTRTATRTREGTSLPSARWTMFM